MGSRTRPDASAHAVRAIWTWPASPPLGLQRTVWPRPAWGCNSPRENRKRAVTYHLQGAHESQRQRPEVHPHSVGSSLLPYGVSRGARSSSARAPAIPATRYVRWHYIDAEVEAVPVSPDTTYRRVDCAEDISPAFLVGASSGHLASRSLPGGAGGTSAQRGNGRRKEGRDCTLLVEIRGLGSRTCTDGVKARYQSGNGSVSMREARK